MSSTTANISTKLLTTLCTHKIFYQLRTNRTYLTRFLTTLLLSLNTLSALSSSQGLPYHLFLCTLLTQTIYLLCLFTEKSTWTLGSLTLLSDVFGLVARLNNSETFLGASLIAISRISLYSIQEYPMAMTCISGLIYCTFHFIWQSYLAKSYEIYTDTYNFPAVAVHNFIKEHLTTLLVVFVSSMGASTEKNKTQEAHSKLKQEFKKISGKHEVDTNALIKLKNELKQVIQSQDLLVTYMSHEFRNHLNIILGNLDVLFGLARDQAQTEILKSCKICGDLLLSQINNLLDVAKINTGRLDISEFPTKMTNFLNEFWSTMKRCTIKKGLIGELAIDKTFPLWINIDSQRVQQILYNILDNAVKFTSKGSVKVMFCWADNTSDDLEDQSVILEEESMVFDNTLQRTKSVKLSNMHYTKPQRSKTLFKETLEHIDCTKQIILNTHQVDHANLDQMLTSRESTQSLGYLKVYISDTGSGILEEDQKKIYDPFIQVDGTVTRSHAGSGLGLFIVNKLVEKMNGEIKLESEVNKGSCFKVILPLTTFSREGIISFRSSYHINSDLHIRDKRKTSTAKPTTVGRLPVSSPKKFLAEVHWSNEPKRVLIVDDIEFNRSLMHTYFRSMHFEADFACNGLEALQMYQDNPDRYFAVTLDIQMPVMDGVTACKSIRNYEKRVSKKRKVPIIIVTGNADDDEKRQILSQDEVMADYFFRKPFGLNDCRICVQNILSAQTAETEM